MKRRQLLKRLAAGTAGILSAAAAPLATPALAQGRKQLKMVTIWPKNFPGYGTGAERLAKRISAVTAGKISVKVFAAGELVPALGAFDAVSGGTAEMYHAVEYFWQGKSKAFNFFCAVPFGLTANEMTSWVRFGGGQTLWDELSAQFNVKPFQVGNSGVQMGGWYNKEIKTLEDFKGLKIRMPGLGGEVLRRIGATAVNIPPAEIFSSLQSGAIDATEWVGPWNDLAFGLHRIAKYYYYPGFHEPGTVTSCGINKKVWDGLSPGERAAIEITMQAENDEQLAEYNARNNDSLDALINKHGVQLRRFSDEVLQAIGNAAGEVVAAAGASDALTKRVYDSFIKFRKTSIEWSKIAEQAYLNARLLSYNYG